MNAPAPDCPEVVKPRRVVRWLIAIGIVLAVAAVGGWKFYGAVELQWLAEKSLHAERLVCDLVEEAIEKNPEHGWPRSWDELERLPARDGGMYSWPRDAPVIKELVVIEFSASVEQIVQQPDTAFVEIRCKDPRVQSFVQPYTHGFVSWLRSGEYRSAPEGNGDNGAP